MKWIFSFITLPLFLLSFGVVAANDALFISQSVPSIMVAGQSYNVSVTMGNTGTSTWTAADNFRLGSQNPQDNWNWGSNRVYLSDSDSVAPGQNKTFTFNVVPSAVGSFSFQWRMLRENVEWFGDYSSSVNITVNENNSGRVTVNGTDFYLGGRKWFPYGINYFPSHFSHDVEPNASIRSWYESPYYESNLLLIEADLSKIEELGFNSIWILYNPFYSDINNTGPNLNDFLERAESHNLKVGLSTGSCHPFVSGHRDLCLETIQDLSELGVITDDTVFAYDLAWEVRVGDYSSRNELSDEWYGWIVDRYGSISRAESAWGYTLNRTLPGQYSLVLSHDLPSRMVAGDSYNVSVSFKNKGTYSWDRSSNYRLGATRNSSLFAGSRHDLGQEESIASGYNKTFTFQMTAPANPGNYTSGWRMLQEYVAWFGEELVWDIEVVESGDAVRTTNNYADDLVCGPTDEELCNDGPATKMVTAYRRFIDDYANGEFGAMIRDIRAYDNEHLITARMGYGGNGNFGVCSRLPLDIRTSSIYFDFISYESWGYTGDSLEGAGFIPNYAGNTYKPVINLEFGYSTGYVEDPSKYETQDDVYRLTYDMALESGTDGAFGWWFKGLRPMENSDYGIVRDNEALDEKPACETVRSYAPLMLNLSERTPDYWITVDRDLHAGDWQMYEDNMDDYAEAVDLGNKPGVKTSCTGNNSMDKAYTDGILPKCLGALFDGIALQDSTGEWITATDGDTINVVYNTPLYVRVNVTNTNEAKWLSTYSTGGGNGTVRLGGNENYGLGFRKDLQNDVSWTESVCFGEFKYSNGITQPANITFQMVSEHVTWFGGRIDVLLVPQSTTTTTTSTSTTSKTTTTSTTSTTIAQCVMPGNDLPCDEVSINELVQAINSWAAGDFNLIDVVDLINSWSDPGIYPPA